MIIKSAYEYRDEDEQLEEEEGSYIEGFQALRVHPLCVVDPVAVVVVVMVVVIVIHGLGAAGRQVLCTHTELRLHRVIAP